MLFIRWQGETQLRNLGLSTQHDNRLICVLRKLKENYSAFDFRDVFLCKNDRPPSHLNDIRTIDVLIHNWEFRTDMLGPLHEPVVIFDDVITKGTSFKAAQRLLKNQQPSLKLIGLFIARTELMGS